MKKFLGVCVLLLGCLSFSQALEVAQVKNAVSRGVASSLPLVRFEDEKQAEFNKLLVRAAKVMKKHDLNPADLGMALGFWIPRAMEFEKESRLIDAGETVSYPVELTEDEFRAAQYAVLTLIPAEYNDDVLYIKEYLQENPVKNWTLYRQHCKEAFELVYDAVEGIANETEGFEYSILKALTH